MSAALRVELDLGQLAGTGAVHLIAVRREPYRIGQEVRRIRVIAGTAWLSAAGRDIILLPGDALTLSPGLRDAVISGVKNALALVELEG